MFGRSAAGNAKTVPREGTDGSRRLQPPPCILSDLLAYLPAHILRQYRHTNNNYPPRHPKTTNTLHHHRRRRRPVIVAAIPPANATKHIPWAAASRATPCPPPLPPLRRKKKRSNCTTRTPTNPPSPPSASLPPSRIVITACWCAIRHGHLRNPPPPPSCAPREKSSGKHESQGVPRSGGR